MSALGTLAIALVSIWAGVLTIVTAILVRQVALLSGRVDPDYALDGLAVGRRLPGGTADLLPAGSGGVLVLGAGCGPCRELVDDLRGFEIGRPLVAIIEGDERQAEVLAEALPLGVESMVGATADRAFSSLDLQTTPFLFLAERRKIVHKAVPQGARHLLVLLQAEEPVSRQPERKVVELQNAS